KGRGSARSARPTRVPVTAAGAVGVAVAAAVGMTAGWSAAAAAGWTVAAAVYVAWTWWVIGRMNPDETAAHATREDPGRAFTDVIVLAASVASLAGVLDVLAAGSSKGGAAEAVSACLGVASVAGAWLVVHSVFAVRDALL